jgi:hypothetical protein
MEEFYEYPLFENYLVYNDGRVYSKRSRKFLKAGIDRNGYQYVILCNENGRCNIKISRLVADHFVENENNENEVDHIDRNKLNNHFTNLRWVSSSENNLNKNKRKDNKTGFIGVCLNEKKHYWQASFCKDGKQIRKCFTFKKDNEIDKEEKFKQATNWRKHMTDENYDKNYFNGNI